MLFINYVLKMLSSVSIKYDYVWKWVPQGNILCFFPEIGSFSTSPHFLTDSSLMSELITCTCSEWTSASIKMQYYGILYTFKWMAVNYIYFIWVDLLCNELRDLSSDPGLMSDMITFLCSKWTAESPKAFMQLKDNGYIKHFLKRWQE
jgi:hypothetical protein